MTQLTGTNIKLRAPEPEDLEYLYLWENDTSVWQVSNTLTPFSRYTLRAYIESAQLDLFEAKQLRLMIDIMGPPEKTIGTIDLYDFDPFHNRAGIGILIGDKSQRKKGYASEALRLLIEYCFLTLSIHQLFCNISADNSTSIQLFQNFGFVKAGEKKAWLKTPDGWKTENFYQLIQSE
jgi:diamine N-acetyltransferase